MTYKATISILLILCMIVLCAALPTFAQQPLRIAIGANIPPYVLADQDRGIEVDIIRTVYSHLGIPIEIRYLPGRRLPHDFKDGGLDAVCVYSSFASSGSGVDEMYPSHTTISFHNSAITLRDGPDITALSDLTGHSVVSFINARRYLGKEYERAINPNRRYMEVNDQSLQAELLFARRFSVVVSEKRTFMYWLRRVTQQAAKTRKTPPPPVVFHDIFPECTRCLFFISEEQRDLFNQGLEAVRSLGAIQSIIASYLDNLE